MSGRSSRELLAAGAAAATVAALFYACAQPSALTQTKASELSSGATRSQHQLGNASPVAMNSRVQGKGNSALELESKAMQPPVQSNRPVDTRVYERDTRAASLSPRRASALPTPDTDDAGPECAPAPALPSNPECQTAAEHVFPTTKARVTTSQRLSVSASAWIKAMEAAPRVRMLPLVPVPSSSWITVVNCCLPLSVETAGQLCFETELERDWHTARGDRELLIGGWQTRRKRVSARLESQPPASSSWRILSYKTDPGLPRLFNDTASVKVTESQTLQQLNGEEWVVASVATFEGLPKCDCLRVHTRYSFVSLPAGTDAATSAETQTTQVKISVGAEWVAGVGVPWVLQRLLERKILQDGREALIDWERRVLHQAASFQSATRHLSGNYLQTAPSPEPEFENSSEPEPVPEPEPEHEHVPEPEVASAAAAAGAAAGVATAAATSALASVAAPAPAPANVVAELEPERLDSEDFSQWSKVALAREEARILAELAAMDANRKAHVPYPPKDPPQDPPRKLVRFNASVLCLRSDYAVVKSWCLSCVPIGGARSRSAVSCELV